MDVLAPMIVTIGLVLAVASVLRTVMANRQQLKLTQLSNEMQTRILDKFENSTELLSFLESPAGQRFATYRVPDRGAYHRRVIGSVQAGVTVLVVGVALLVLSSQLPQLYEPFLFLGVFGVALGVGFLVAALAAYGLSKKWGLLNGESGGEAIAQLPID